MHWLKILWKRWKVIGRKIGDFQARLILSLFYFVVLAPFAMGVKFFSDPLLLKSTRGWQRRSDNEGDAVLTARRQF